MTAGRIAEVERTTGETSVKIRLGLDGSGRARLDHPIGFMAHMLDTFARHGLFDLEVTASGDLHVDQHHIVEDTGIVLGSCFAGALGDKRGIRRSGGCLFPMDETLASAAVDLSGRPFLFFEGRLSGLPLVGGHGGFQTDTVEDFWQGFVGAAACNLHLEIVRGRSDHHKIEAMFKAAARSLRAACEVDERAGDSVPSTKGTLGSPGIPSGVSV
ncbi:MAG: imidazoleglycerol-phosphate dehydratase HisB [Treponema sp.]|nr:imidazoleglycerol-phosphate dehydratase HisB [Treponema sp.]